MHAPALCSVIQHNLTGLGQVRRVGRGGALRVEEAESKLETDLRRICRELGEGPGVLAGSMWNPSLGTVSL